jgi:hypothetical protein
VESGGYRPARKSTIIRLPGYVSSYLVEMILHERRRLAEDGQSGKGSGRSLRIVGLLQPLNQQLQPVDASLPFHHVTLGKDQVGFIARVHRNLLHPLSKASPNAMTHYMDYLDLAVIKKGKGG